MITTNKTYADGICITELYGLSTDVKPMDVCNSSVFFEMDTSSLYMFDEHNKVWLRYSGGGGGGGGGSVEGFATLTFMNGDEFLFTRPVYIGDDCPDPVTQGRISKPTKESTETTNYTHNGWSTTDGGSASSSALKNITGDRTVYAAFAESVKNYTITFYDGTTLLQTLRLPYGATPAPNIPTHSTDPLHYAFDYWTPSITTVTGDASYTAVWGAKHELADFTWEELAELSIDDVRANFHIGDIKQAPDLSWYTLIGIAHDDLADGSGKANMTFMAQLCAPFSTTLRSFGTVSSDWLTSSAREALRKRNSYRTDFREVYDLIKPVTKKYVTTSEDIAECEDTAFMVSLSELGYTTAPQEGARYDFFSAKTSITDPMPETIPRIPSYTRTLVSTLPTEIAKVYLAGDGTAPTEVSKSDSLECLTFAFCI